MKRKNFRLSIALIVFALVGVMFASAACASVSNVNDSANSANSAVTVTESGKKNFGFGRSEQSSRADGFLQG